MSDPTRRAFLGGSGIMAMTLLSGCLTDSQVPGTEPHGDERDSSETPGASSTTPSSDRSGSTSGSAHGGPYPVTLSVRARPIEEDAVEASAVTALATADLSDRERTLLVDVVEREETDEWSGRSDEPPPERLRTLITLTDRLPPSPADRDPADAWRDARGTTAYVEYEDTTYVVEMVKIAP